MADDERCSHPDCSKRAWHKGACNYHAILSFYRDNHIIPVTPAGDGTRARAMMNSVDRKPVGEPMTKNGIRRIGKEEVVTARARQSGRG